MTIRGKITKAVAKKAAGSAWSWVWGKVRAGASWTMLYGKIIAAASVITIVVVYIARAERAVARNGVLVEKNQAEHAKFKASQKSYEDCHAANVANAKESDRMALQVKQALENIDAMDDQAKHDIEDIYEQANEFRANDTDTQCRTLHDPFPESFVASVRKPPG